MIRMTKQKRQRGVMLTLQGLQKLEAGKFELEIAQNHSNPFTFEGLSSITRLDARTVARILDRQVGVDRRSLVEFFQAFHLTLEPKDFTQFIVEPKLMEQQLSATCQDWGNATEPPVFYGRLEELSQLKGWILGQCCRLVMILGMGGMGKTALCTKLMKQVAPQFEFVIWRSLRSAPPLEVLLLELLQFLSQGQEMTLPPVLEKALSRLVYYLSQHRCCLILDNLESIFHQGGTFPETRAGCYRQGYEEYGEFLEQVAKLKHQSCILLTSREQPKAINQLERRNFPVRTLQLQGLQGASGRAILEHSSSMFGSEVDWQTVIEHYAGNPLALEIIAPVIQEYLNGNLPEFVSYLKQEQLVFHDIRRLLEQQFQRLTALEQQVMNWLAINREKATLAQIQEDMVPAVSFGELLEAIDSLRRRSLLEKHNQFFTVKPVVAEYMTEGLIQQKMQNFKFLPNLAISR